MLANYTRELVVPELRDARKRTCAEPPMPRTFGNEFARGNVPLVAAPFPGDRWDQETV
jgi:hypothetical protein